jgi:hypothetical protein
MVRLIVIDKQKNSGINWQKIMASIDNNCKAKTTVCIDNNCKTESKTIYWQ